MKIAYIVTLIGIGIFVIGIMVGHFFKFYPNAYWGLVLPDYIVIMGIVITILSIFYGRLPDD